jgi:hypothetical protein
MVGVLFYKVLKKLIWNYPMSHSHVLKAILYFNLSLAGLAFQVTFVENVFSEETYVTSTTAMIVNSGTLDSASPIIDRADIPNVSDAGVSWDTATTYIDLISTASASIQTTIYDSTGISAPVTIFYFHIDTDEFLARFYISSEFVDPLEITSGIPRSLGEANLVFSHDPGLCDVGVACYLTTPVVTPITINWKEGPDTNVTATFQNIFLTPSTDFEMMQISQNGCAVTVTPTPTPPNGVTEDTVPSAPIINVAKNNISFFLQLFNPPIKYLLHLTREGKTIKIESSSNELKLNGLESGTWKGRYQVIADTVKSKQSKSKKFVISAK